MTNEANENPQNTDDIDVETAIFPDEDFRDVLINQRAPTIWDDSELVKFTPASDDTVCYSVKLPSIAAGVEVPIMIVPQSPNNLRRRVVLTTAAFCWITIGDTAGIANIPALFVTNGFQLPLNIPFIYTGAKQIYGGGNTGASYVTVLIESEKANDQLSNY